jgi:hypothetical protein
MGYNIQMGYKNAYVKRHILINLLAWWNIDSLRADDLPMAGQRVRRRQPHSALP